MIRQPRSGAFSIHMKRTFVLLQLLLVPLALLAHDTWLIPSSFTPTAGQSVRLRLATSEAFPSSDGAVTPDRVARFTIHSMAGKKDVTGFRVDGKFLVADVTVPQRGQSVLVLETKPRIIVLQPKEFNEYVGDEALQHVIAARARNGQDNSPGRERYRKITKTVLCSGMPTSAPGEDLSSTPENLWLEIVPERGPCGLKTGDAFSMRVLFEGKPLVGAHLAAGYEGVTGHKYPIWIPTDKDGRAVVKLDRAGVRFVRVLHMVPAKNDPEADWQSAFSTLTFEVHK